MGNRKKVYLSNAPTCTCAGLRKQPCIHATRIQLRGWHLGGRKDGGRLAANGTHLVLQHAEIADRYMPLLDGRGALLQIPKGEDTVMGNH